MRAEPSQAQANDSTSQNNNCTDYIESTYFTFSINTYQKAFSLDAAQAVGEFLEKTKNYNTQQTDKFLQSTKNLGATLKQVKDYDEIRTSLNRIEKQSDTNEKKNEALKFSALLCDSVISELNANPASPGKLTSGQIDYLLDNLVSRYRVSPDKITRISILDKCKSDDSGNALMNDLALVN